MSPFKLERIGMIMEPEAGNEQEIEGVLNPASPESDTIPFCQVPVLDYKIGF